MGRRSRQRRREDPAATATAGVDYTDGVGNVLTLRERLSRGTLEQLADLHARPAASQEDRWQRRMEFLFERFALSWTIAGLPLTGQKELLGRYRMADDPTRRWVRQTVEDHLRAAHPEAAEQG
jgi:hypothetical protein